MDNRDLGSDKAKGKAKEALQHFETQSKSMRFYHSQAPKPL
jgi:hypothetical protein